MQIAPHPLEMMIRPRMLITAARHALAEYNREVFLPRLLGLTMGRQLPDPAAALHSLIDVERHFESARKRHDASWRAPDHIAVLTALLHEAALCHQLAAAPVTLDHDREPKLRAVG